MGGARRDRAARAAERAGREWVQSGGVIPTCAGRAVAGVNAESCPNLKDAEQEECRDACRRRKCSRPEDLLLAQAESEGRWRAVSVGVGARRGAGAEAGAGARRRERGGGRRETLPPRQRGRGELGRQTNLPWWR
jgi:hypothetical protein